MVVLGGGLLLLYPHYYGFWRSGFFNWQNIPGIPILSGVLTRVFLFARELADLLHCFSKVGQGVAVEEIFEDRL